MPTPNISSQFISFFYIPGRYFRVITKNLYYICKGGSSVCLHNNTTPNILTHYFMKRLYLASFLAGISLSAGGFQALASQPYGYCWHPEHLIAWDGNDPDLRFNRSTVALQPRVKLTGSMKANSDQQSQGQILNATILAPRCSAAPSQGAYTFTGYQPTYWQYVDKLVYWAGSASEGIIIPPPAPSIDAAHLSGVKILGQVFFPPTYYGGKTEWVTTMLTREADGSYPYAEKLFEVARDLGFDGWFINEETGGGSDSQWREFVEAFNARADREGYTDMEIQWYNASRMPNIEILNAHPNTSQFLEYGAVGDKRSYAAQLNCTEEETFSKLYAGIECVRAGLTGYGSYLNSAFPSTGSRCSVALFCPEEHSWKDNVRSILDTEDCGPKAHEAVAKVFEDEEKVWVNANGDPSRPGTSWKGISGYIEERSSVTSIPFHTDFCVGVGKAVYADGMMLSEADWNNSGVQSVLPTWRWWIENAGFIKASIDWDNAYSLGNSILIKGLPESGRHLIRLYKTDLLLGQGDFAVLTFQGEAPELALSTTASLEPDVIISPVSVDAVGDWKQARYDLSALSGKNIYMIALEPGELDFNKEYSLRLGAFSLLPGRTLQSVSLSDLSLDADLGQESGCVRVYWNADTDTDLDYFRVLAKSGDRILKAGNTRGHAFYFPEIGRTDDGALEIEVQAVLKDGSIGNSIKTTTGFEELQTPDVRYSLTKSYLRVGDTATVTAKASNFPTDYKWTVPAGLEVVEYPAENAVTVKATAIGIYNVAVDVTNQAGTTHHECETIDVFTPSEFTAIGNIMIGKTVVDYSGAANDKEIPENLIDGVRSPTSTSAKWCSLDDESWVIFDCGDIYRMYGFRIFDCKAGPENLENFHSYTVEVSRDGSYWTRVVDETGLQALNIKENYISPVEARYIRFSPKVSGVLRVWEFETFGKLSESGVGEIEAADDRDEIAEIYSPDGLRLSGLVKGTNIVKYRSGKTAKIIR